MEYSFDPSASKPGAAPALTAVAAAQLQVHVPFTHWAPRFPSPFTAARSSCRSPRAQARSKTSPSSSISAPARRARHPAAASGRTCPRGAGLAPSASAIPSGCTTRSSFASGPGRTVTLRCSFASGDAHPRPARAAQISFVLPAGALKIYQLELSGETYTPYKGVRGRALGRVKWRVEWKGG
ncbi:hypothetical protein EDB85DRAFT_1274262 [Lactarius pseudohatsudake]|nr:hypothetical protein EDB85DRAFT_1274262 [Lactarius pseudohatsudake]